MLDAVSIDAASNSALIVMAVAVSIQAIVMIVALVGIAMAWRRLQAVVDERYTEIKSQVDDAVGPIREAAHAVEHVSAQASSAIDHAGHAAGVLKTLVIAPRTAAVYGVASLASAVLKRWPRKRTGPRAVPASGPRVVH
jgi:hypothetical protein